MDSLPKCFLMLLRTQDSSRNEARNDSVIALRELILSNHYVVYDLEAYRLEDVKAVRLVQF